MNKSARHRIALVSSLLFAPALSWPAPVAAEAALALGVPASVAKQGVSMGYSTNQSSTEIAKAKALEQCRATGSAVSKSLCAVVETFRDQCVALAIDPKPGTPGFGWAIAEDEPAANRRALVNCGTTAGPGRRDACSVKSHCDKTAK